MARRWAIWFLALFCMALSFGLAGCNGQAAPLTSDEKSNFKGGPMPESARIKMQERMSAAKQQSAQGDVHGPASN